MSPNDLIVQEILGVSRGDLVYLQYLIDSSADVNTVDGDGVSLLMLLSDADYSNRAQVAQFLISKGARIDTKDKLGRTALFYAVRYGNDIDLVQALAATVDKNACDNYHVSILTWAIWLNNYPLVVLLLSWGCDVNFPDSMGGSTPLQEAASSPNPLIRAAFGLP